MRKLIIIALFSALGTAAWAQNATVKGIVVDTSGTALEMVSVALLNPSDSTLEHFGVTNSKGQYILKEVAPGNYEQIVSFIGYEKYTAALSIEKGQVQKELDQVVITPQLNQLSEVVVSGKRIPVVINKDTVEYNASAFKVRAEETVEDLLRKLPGIEVDINGRIKAQGEEVNRVLVDGKEFFGGDPLMATQNLPATAIENVKVYDGVSEGDKFKGVDQAETQKTMDLTLKEEYKKGYFANVNLGAGASEEALKEDGTEDHMPFKLKGGIHMFNKTSRLSVLSNSNNLNEYGFSWGDAMAMSGASMSGSSISITIDDNSIPMTFMRRGGQGRSTSAVNGVNWNYTPTKKLRVATNYFHTRTNNFTLNESNTDWIDDQANVKGASVLTSRAKDYNHKLATRLNWELDSMNRIEVSANGDWGGSSLSSLLEDNRTHPDSTLQLQLMNNDITELGENLSASGSLSWTHKFKKDGRYTDFRISTSHKGSAVQDTLSTFFQSNITGEQYLDGMNRRSDRVNQTASVSIDFVEPVGKKQSVELNYLSYVENRSLVRNAYDKTTGSFLTQYSNGIDIQTRRDRVGLKYRNTNVGILNVNLSLASASQLANDVILMDSVNQRYTYFSPSFYWRSKSSGWDGLKINFYRKIRIPSVSQLMTVIDMSNPNYLVYGNPGLRPSINNSLTISFNEYDMFNDRTYGADLSVTATEHAVIMEQTIDENYRVTSRPVNMVGLQYSSRMGLDWSSAIEKLGIDFTLMPSATWSAAESFVNGVKNSTENYSTSMHFGVSNLNDEKVYLNLSYTASRTWNFYSVNTQLNQSYDRNALAARLHYNPSERLNMRTFFNYAVYSATNFTEGFAIPMWNLNISYALDEGKKNWVGFKVNDILGQNQNVSRSATAISVVESRTNALTRYALLTFRYEFKPKPKAAPE